jgi:hypothetical protein
MAWICLEDPEEEAMQSEHVSRIRNIRDALVAAGFESLDKQAGALGLPRSTTWNIVHGNHKKSGLSASLVTRILKSPRLPASVRAKVIEYIDAKLGDGCGQNRIQQRRFRDRLELADLKLGS